MAGNLVVPQVWSDLIALKFPGKLVFGAVSVTDPNYDLTGKPGDTVIFPNFNLLTEEVEDISVPGTAMTPEQLTQASISATIKAFGKAVKIYDVNAVTAVGDMQENGQEQIAHAFAANLDGAIRATLEANSPVADKSEYSLGYSLLVDAMTEQWGDEFLDDSVLFLNPLQAGSALKDTAFVQATEADVRRLVEKSLPTTGFLGSFLNMDVYVSDRVRRDAETGVFNSIVSRRNTVGYVRKRAFEIETAREILTKSTLIAASSMYATAHIKPQRGSFVLKTK